MYDLKAKPKKDIDKADQFLFHWDLERRIQATIQSQNYENVSTQLRLVLSGLLMLGSYRVYGTMYWTACPFISELKPF